jgi:hypothetical protein
MLPTRKVSVSAVSGAVVALGLLLLNIFDPAVADKINNAAAVAATVVVSTILAYIIPEKDQA